MPIRFEIVRTIAAPPEAVFKALTDLDGARHWMKGLVRIDRLDAGEFRVGSEWRETRKMFGKEATEQFEMTELVPPERLGLRVDGTKGSTKKGEYVFLYRLMPEGAGTRVSLDGEVRGLGRFGELIGRVFVGMFKKACAKDLDAMAGYVEGNASPAG